MNLNFYDKKLYIKKEQKKTRRKKTNNIQKEEEERGKFSAKKWLGLFNMQYNPT